MVINISSSTGLLIFIGLWMPMLLAYQSYFYGRGSYAFLNKSNVECIQGVALIFILLQSIITRVSRPDLILQCIGALGDGALAVYLFMVGYELRKFSLYPKKMVRKRMLSSVVRVLLIFVAGNFLLGVVQIYLGEEISLVEILRHTVKWQFLDGTQASLLVTLFIFYLLVGLTRNLKVITVLGLVAGWPGIFVSLGMWMACYQKMAFLILRKQLLNLSLITGILLMLSVRWNILLPIACVLGTLVVLMKVQFKSKIFRLLSQFTIPLYSFQLSILYLVFYSSEPKSSGLILLSMCICLGLVVVIKAMLVVDLKTSVPVKRS